MLISANIIQKILMILTRKFPIAKKNNKLACNNFICIHQNDLFRYSFRLTIFKRTSESK